MFVQSKLIPHPTPIPVTLVTTLFWRPLPLLQLASKAIGGYWRHLWYLWVDDPTTDQTFEQINLRLNYEATAKLSLYASGGVEFRQFDGNRNTYDFTGI